MLGILKISSIKMYYRQHESSIFVVFIFLSLQKICN